MAQFLPHYLVAIHHPDGYDGSLEGEAMERDIDVLNEEMVAAGVRIFVGGLHAANTAKSLRPQPNGEQLITDGPYLETKEHVGGFWVVAAAGMDGSVAVHAFLTSIKAVRLGWKQRQGAAQCAS